MAGGTPEVALMYDFDKTLSTHDMLDYGFIPRLGLTPDAFWEKAGHIAQAGQMDSVLCYMYLMMQEARAKGEPIRRETLYALGGEVVFFPGVTGWFAGMNAFGAALGLKVRHYIISAGLREVIMGTPIAGQFHKIYACDYHYDAAGEADWPATTVNYTGKTQYLFRINKGVLDVSNDADLNRFTPEEERAVPFGNMIFFGDGMTDIPIMRLTKRNGGRSIAVYTDRSVALPLLHQHRVDFIAPADYRPESTLSSYVRQSLQAIALQHALQRHE
ncbi:MAG: haloacid dehalogenase-like hydrolase [Christensenellales bacterium]